MNTTNYPTSKFYGGWITPKGDLIPVPEEGHAEIALNILYHGQHITESQAETVYTDLYNMQYIRMINLKSGGYALEYKVNQTVTKYQKSYIENASQLALY